MEILFDILKAVCALSVLGAICGGFASLIKGGEEEKPATCALPEKEERNQKAFIRCHGGRDTKRRFVLSDTPDCLVASRLYGGMTECKDACLGLGTCAAACPTRAIHAEDGVMVVDEEKCNGCGKCAALCPRGVISLVPKDRTVCVRCSSISEGYLVERACEAGCIACGNCVKNCKYGAIEIKENLATVDYEKCTGCGACANACERGNFTAPPLPPEEPFNEDEYFELSLEEEEEIVEE